MTDGGSNLRRYSSVLVMENDRARINCEKFSINDRARILERQNVLQTGQVLFRRLCVSLAVVLPFKDSQGGPDSWTYLILIGVTFAGARQ